MGAKPLFALNLVGFPRALLNDGILEDILRGGSDVASEAGIAVLGGHSIDDAEPKYGMVAIGSVHPSQILTNAGALPGDQIVLTKPLGTGVIATAHKADQVPDSVLSEAVRWMTTLNRDAADAAAEFDVHAVTDVTGYGLLGHLRNMLRELRDGSGTRGRVCTDHPGGAGARAGWLRTGWHQAKSVGLGVRSGMGTGGGGRFAGPPHRRSDVRGTSTGAAGRRRDFTARSVARGVRGFDRSGSSTDPRARSGSADPT